MNRRTPSSAYVLEATGEPLPPPALSTPRNQLTYWVVQHQEPLVFPIVEDENPVSASHRRTCGAKASSRHVRCR